MGVGQLLGIVFAKRMGIRAVEPGSREVEDMRELVRVQDGTPSVWRARIVRDASRPNERTVRPGELAFAS
jgi:hypothetical protein